MEALPSNVIDMDAWARSHGIETIAGVRMHLGSMALNQLEVLHEAAEQQLLQAQRDCWIIEGYINKCSPLTGGDAS